MPNIEIKAKYDRLELAQNIALELKAEFVGQDHQIDTYFQTSTGRLKLRESSLSGAQLVPYLRPDQSGPKRSDYLVVPIADAVEFKRLFSAILGVDVVVDKIRDIYLIDNVRVHLDQVKDVGNFFEFEAVYQDTSEASEKSEYAKVEKLMKAFRIKDSDLIQGSYREIVKSKVSN